MADDALDGLFALLAENKYSKCNDYVRYHKLSQLLHPSIGVFLSLEVQFNKLAFLKRQGLPWAHLVEEAGEEKRWSRLCTLCTLRAGAALVYKCVAAKGSFDYAAIDLEEAARVVAAEESPLIQSALLECRLLNYVGDIYRAKRAHRGPDAMALLHAARGVHVRFVRLQLASNSRTMWLSRLMSDVIGSVGVEFNMPVKPAPHVADFKGYSWSMMKQLQYNNIDIACCCVVLQVTHSMIEGRSFPEYSSSPERPVLQGIASYPVIWTAVERERNVDAKLHPSLVSLILSAEGTSRPMVSYDQALQVTFCICSLDEARWLCIAARGKRVDPATPLLQLALGLVGGISLRACASALANEGDKN